MNKKSAVFGTPLDQAQEEEHDAVAEKLTRCTSQCACCGKNGADVHLNACSRCRKTFYCSAQSQKRDWKKHKKACSAPVDWLSGRYNTGA
jgi:hypothetical protein